ncbi:MAG: hypothetical protein ACFFBR_11265 [Promethearchaeota archaeon]
MVSDSLDPIRPTDIGSFPLGDINFEHYIQGAIDLEDGKHTEAAAYFVQQHNIAFIRKLQALGPTYGVPCYVQSSVMRDMLTQFLNPIIRHGSGLDKTGDTYLWDGSTIQLPPRNAQVAELLALQQGAKLICEELSIERIEYRACITGPFEMSTRLWQSMGFSPRYDESLIEAFATIVKAFLKNAQISTKYLNPLIITLDEPSVGVTGVGDIFMDVESDPQLAHLIRTWNRSLSVVRSQCFRGLHLHASPYHQLGYANWNLLEAHLGVVVSKAWLQEHDKFIRAAILQTEEPTIPANIDLRVAWDEIQSGHYQPYLQPQEEMQQYLSHAIDRYGADRVPFAGPECGFGSWNWNYGDEMVLANLRTMHRVITTFNQKQSES